MGDSKKIMQVRSARQVPVRVKLLDDEILDHSVDKRAVGWILFDKVCEHLNILEKDYFGLNYVDVNGIKYWLNNDKKISKQLKGQNWDFQFEVKFYHLDPAQLAEDLTRYQLCLQIRRDIVNEKLPCSFVTYTLLGSYTAQSELGDYDTEEFGSGYRYLKDIQFAPHQDKELLVKIAELHRQHKGQTPEEAEVHFLDNAKKLSMYGVELHAAKDAEGKDISLGVCAAGLIVYKDKSQINKFVWPKVLKISYRRSKYYIKIRPGEFETFASLIGFKLLNVKMAKRLWKISVEHHSFFRFREPETIKSGSLLPRFGSRFRYSGRTQFQTRQIVAEENRDSPYFDRVLSKRGTFAGRTQNMKRRDDDRQHRRDEMRKQPPVSPQTKLPLHEPSRTPPEPKHAPPIAPKPSKPPKPMPRGPPSIDNVSLDREPPESLNDSFEDVPDRKSRMEKMHAVATPLAAIMQKSIDKEKEKEEVHQTRPESDNSSRGPPGYSTDDPESRHNYEVGKFENRFENTNKLILKHESQRGDVAESGEGLNRYLFSYPSSSIDSVLSKDYDDYEADVKHAGGKYSNVKTGSIQNLSHLVSLEKHKSNDNSLSYRHSAENILIDCTYIEGENVEGIYAEIDEVNAQVKQLQIKENQKSVPKIHGRKSILFKENQKWIPSHESVDPTDLEGASVKNKKLLTPASKTETSLGTKFQSALYAKINKKLKPEKSVSLKDNNGPKHKTLNKKCQDRDQKSNDSSSDENSRTKLREELKMYILTPEKMVKNQNISNKLDSSDKDLQTIQHSKVESKERTSEEADIHRHGLALSGKVDGFVSIPISAEAIAGDEIGKTDEMETLTAMKSSQKTHEEMTQNNDLSGLKTESDKRESMKKHTAEKMYNVSDSFNLTFLEQARMGLEEYDEQNNKCEELLDEIEGNQQENEQNQRDVFVSYGAVESLIEEMRNDLPSIVQENEHQRGKSCEYLPVSNSDEHSKIFYNHTYENLPCRPEILGFNMTNETNVIELQENKFSARGENASFLLEDSNRNKFVIATNNRASSIDSDKLYLDLNIDDHSKQAASPSQRAQSNMEHPTEGGSNHGSRDEKILSSFLSLSSLDDKSEPRSVSPGILISDFDSDASHTDIRTKLGCSSLSNLYQITFDECSLVSQDKGEAMESESVDILNSSITYGEIMLGNQLHIPDHDLERFSNLSSASSDLDLRYNDFFPDSIDITEADLERFSTLSTDSSDMEHDDFFRKTPQPVFYGDSLTVPGRVHPKRKDKCTDCDQSISINGSKKSDNILDKENAQKADANKKSDELGNVKIETKDLDDVGIMSSKRRSVKEENEFLLERFQHLDLLNMKSDFEKQSSSGKKCNQSSKSQSEDRSDTSKDRKAQLKPKCVYKKVTSLVKAKSKSKQKPVAENLPLDKPFTCEIYEEEPYNRLKVTNSDVKSNIVYSKTSSMKGKDRTELNKRKQSILKKSTVEENDPGEETMDFFTKPNTLKDLHETRRECVSENVSLQIVEMTATPKETEIETHVSKTSEQDKKQVRFENIDVGEKEITNVSQLEPSQTKSGVDKQTVPIAEAVRPQFKAKSHQPDSKVSQEFPFVHTVKSKPKSEREEIQPNYKPNIQIAETVISESKEEIDLISKQKKPDTFITTNNAKAQSDSSPKSQRDPYWFRKHLLPKQLDEIENDVKTICDISYKQQIQRKSGNDIGDNIHSLSKHAKKQSELLDRCKPHENIHIDNETLKEAVKCSEKLMKESHKKSYPLYAGQKEQPTDRIVEISEDKFKNISKAEQKENVHNNHREKTHAQEKRNIQNKVPIIKGSKVFDSSIDDEDINIVVESMKPSLSKPPEKTNTEADIVKPYINAQTDGFIAGTSKNDIKASNLKQHKKKATDSFSSDLSFRSSTTSVQMSSDSDSDKSQNKSTSSYTSSSHKNISSGKGTKKVSPGVVHIINPCPSGWIEGGIKSSPKKVRKPVTAVSKYIVSVLDFEPVTFKRNEDEEMHISSVLDFEYTSNETNNSQVESVAHGIPGGDEISEQAEKDLTQTDIKVTNEIEVSPDILYSAPKADLLCKRVWTYSKGRKCAKEQQSDKIIPNDDTDSEGYDFDSQINKGPYNNMETPTSFKDEDKDKNQVTEYKSKKQLDSDKDKTKCSSSYTKLKTLDQEKDQINIILKRDNDGDENFSQNEWIEKNLILVTASQNVNTGLDKELAQDEEKEEKSNSTRDTDNDGLEIEQYCDRKENMIVRENAVSLNLYPKVVTAPTKGKEGSINKLDLSALSATTIYMPVLNTDYYDHHYSSDSEPSETDTDSDSGQSIELAAFEMPKPKFLRQNSQYSDPEEVDILCADEEILQQYRKDPIIDFEDNNSFAIDCSFEDVTSYKVSDSGKGKDAESSILCECVFTGETTDIPNDIIDITKDDRTSIEKLYWDDEDDDVFKDYNDEIFGYGCHLPQVPEVIDNTPHVPIKSNLKCYRIKETSLFNRRVHFQEDLPVYKSTKNIQTTHQTYDKLPNDPEQEKMQYLENFITCLFDKEPRNLSINGDNSGNRKTDFLKGKGDELKADDNTYLAEKKPSDNMVLEGNDWSFHSNLTSENIICGTEILSDIRNSPENMVSNSGHTDDNGIVNIEIPVDVKINAICKTVPKKANKNIPHIIKPVTGKIQKNVSLNYESDTDNSEDFEKENKDSLGNKNSFGEYNYNMASELQNEVKATVKSFQVKDNNWYNNEDEVKDTSETKDQEYITGIGQVHVSQCSAELKHQEFDTLKMFKTSNQEKNFGNSYYDGEKNKTSPNKWIRDEDSGFIENWPLPVNKKSAQSEYGDVSLLGKLNTSHVETPQTDEHLKQEKVNHEDIVKEAAAVHPKDSVDGNITKYTYTVTDDSGEDSPKIKSVTYEYITEYKLNNVKIHYQQNQKVQTDEDSLTEMRKTAPGSYSGHSIKGNIPKRRVIDVDCQTENVMSEQNLQNTQQRFERTGIYTGDLKRKNSDTSIKVEEVMERSVCFPLGPISGFPSIFSDKSDADNEIEEVIERSTCHKLGPAKSNYADIGNSNEQLSKITPQGETGVTSELKTSIMSAERSIKYGIVTEQDLEQDRGPGSQGICGNVMSDFHEPGAEKPVKVKLEFMKDKTTRKHLNDSQSVSQIGVLPSLQGESSAKNRRGKLTKDVVVDCDQSLGNLKKNWTLCDEVDSDCPFEEYQTAETDVKSTSCLDAYDEKRSKREMQSLGNETVSNTRSDNCLNRMVYCAVMQETLPNLHIEESTQETMFIVQAMAVIALGTVLVFILPYMG